MKKVKDKIQNLVKGSLAKKTSVAIGVVVVICLTLMVLVSATLSRIYLTRSINSEFEGIAAKNGVTVQSILDIASSSASDLQNYIEDQYDEYEKTGYSGEVEKSTLYDVKLQRMNKDIEDYILHTAWSTVSGSKYISGIGVFFEPKAFDPAIEDYTIYVNDSDAESKKCQSYGAYSEYGSQDYYTEAAKNKTTVFTDPYEDQGIKMVTAAFPIIYKDEVQGVVVVDINIENFKELSAKSTEYKSMYVDVLTEDSTMVYDSESTEYVGQKLSDLLDAKQYKKIKAGTDTKKSFSVITKKDDGTLVSRYYTPINAEGETWWAASALNKSDLYSNATHLTILMILIAVIAVVVTVFFAAYMIRKNIKPIEKVVAASEQLKKGDFSIDIKAESDDEIGQLSDAFSQAASQLRAVIHDIKAVLNQMAANDFNIKPSVEYPGDFASIKDSLYSVVSDISGTLSEINTVSEEVSANADNISQGAQAITEGATDQASAVQELQATITNVSEEVDKNAENAKEANNMAKVVGEEIRSRNDDMQQVVEAMEVINDSSMQIDSIINTINDIAAQTNLLALNASIEAARAGEAGKGFAVVATQVGALATQSAEAAETSNELIVNTIQAVEKGKRLVDVAAKQLLESAEKTKDLVSNIGEITVASENQASALSQILQATDQIAAVVEENTAMAEESSASSEELAAQAARLQELIEVFKLYVKEAEQEKSED